MTRALLGALAAGAVLVGGAAAIDGCGDDRARTAALIYYCDPTSATADDDCGGTNPKYACYSATASLGHAFCVPTCNHADPTTCDGVCTVAGECLQQCTVPTGMMKDPCPSPLRCVRRTVSSFEVKNGNDGVCLAVNAICTTSEDCTSSVFNECSGQVTAGYDIDGSICIDVGCAANGAACEPGSSCLQKVLPIGSAATPDVCTPDCVERKDANGNHVFECEPGFMCLTTAFPAENLHICAPGSGGWLCADHLDCVAGTCKDWHDVSPALAQLMACAPPCMSDDDCTVFDRFGNPNFITKLTCHPGGVCRALVSMLYPVQCFSPDQPCTKLDSTGAVKCTRPEPSSVVEPPDGGTNGPGAGPTCTRTCSSNSECDGLTAVTHVPHLCDAAGRCAPALPFAANCVPGPSSGCLGDLTCMTIAIPNQPPFGACTRTCAADADCASDPMLGSTFTCAANNICVPKSASGEPGLASQCLSGRAVMGTCVSPSKWPCDKDHGEQCESGKCTNGQCE